MRRQEDRSRRPYSSAVGTRQSKCGLFCYGLSKSKSLGVVWHNSFARTRKRKTSASSKPLSSGPSTEQLRGGTLARMSNSAIASRIGVSRWCAGRIRLGYRPHPRHWLGAGGTGWRFARCAMSAYRHRVKTRSTVPKITSSEVRSRLRQMQADATASTALPGAGGTYGG